MRPEDMAIRMGPDLPVEQGYLPGRQTGINVPGGLRQAVGSQNRVPNPKPTTINPKDPRHE